MARIFISHSSRDQQQAADLKAWLTSIGFEQTFLDFDTHAGIPPGADWERTLYREIERAQAVLLILTKNWFDSKWCFAEFTQARALGKAIFALVEAPIGETTVVSPDIQHLNLTNNRTERLESLSRELTHVALNAQGGFDWQVGSPPYPGLLSFEADNAAIFFGRDDDVLRAIERISARRIHGGSKLVAILGASGSGKSSLLKAGILPRVARDRTNFLVVPPFRPGSDPIRNFLNALHGIDLSLTRNDLNAIDGPDEARNLIDRLRKLAKAPQATLIIPVDQAEETFTSQGKQVQDAFFKLLSIILAGENPALGILTLRSDHLPDLQTAENLTVPIEEFSLKPMPIERLGLIVNGPAKIVGLAVEQGLVSALMRDAKTHDALPLVAFILRRLYDRHSSGGILTQAHSELMRDSTLTPLDVAVRDAAAEAMAKENPTKEVVDALREAFVPALVRVNDEGGFVRQSARVELLSAQAHRMLRALADARLLVIDNGVVEVAHESLFRVWPLLANWLEEEREFLVTKSRIERSREDYARLPEAARSKGLLSGIILERAKNWLITHPKRFTSDETSFIGISIEEADRRERELAEQRERLRQAELAQAKAEAERATHQATATKRFLRFAVGAVVVLACLGGVAIYYWLDANAAQKQANIHFNLAIDQAASNVDAVVDNYQSGRISTSLLNLLISRAQTTVDSLNSDTSDAAAAKARLLRAVGRAYLVLSQASLAELKAREGLKIADTFLARNPTSPEWMQLVARAQTELAQALFWKGDLEGALAHLQLAVTIAKNLVAKDSDNRDHNHDLIEIYRFTGDGLRNQAKIDQALLQYRNWLDLANQLAEKYPAENKWLRGQMFARQRMGDVLLAQNIGAAARKEYEIYLALALEAVKREPDNKEFAEAVSIATARIGDSFFIDDDLNKAMEKYQTFLQLAEKLAKADQSNFIWNQNLEVAHQRIGEVHLQKGNFGAAKIEFDIYLQMATDTLDKDPNNGTALYDVTNAIAKVGDALRGQKNYAEALKHYRNMLSSALILKKKDVSNAAWNKILANSHQRIGLILELQGDRVGAVASYHSCVGIKVPTVLWTLRDMWPRDVNDYCQKKIDALNSPG
jgi:tetratricopeptide (TPR) repeat protein